MKIKEGGGMDIQNTYPEYDDWLKTNMQKLFESVERLPKEEVRDIIEVAGRAIWQAAKAQAVPAWISVKDNLPPANILVLGMSQTPRNIFNIYNVMALDEFEEADVTHWMPLPDAPQELAND